MTRARTATSTPSARRESRPVLPPPEPPPELPCEVEGAAVVPEVVEEPDGAGAVVDVTLIMAGRLTVVP